MQPTSLPNLSEAVQILEDPKQMIPQEIHKKGRGTFKLKKVYTHYANKKSLRTKKRWRAVAEEMRYAVHDEWCACIITFFSAVKRRKTKEASLSRKFHYFIELSDELSLSKYRRCALNTKRL